MNRTAIRKTVALVTLAAFVIAHPVSLFAQQHRPQHSEQLSPAQQGRTTAGGQSTKNSTDFSKEMWNNVKALKERWSRKVVVRLKNGKRVKGQVNMVSDTGLLLLRKKKMISIEREEVERIFRVERVDESRMGALLGLGGGIFAAVELSDALCAEGRTACRAKVIAIPGMLIIGAGLVAGMGIGGRVEKYRVLVYDVNALKPLSRSYGKRKRTKGKKAVALPVSEKEGPAAGGAGLLTLPGWERSIPTAPRLETEASFRLKSSGK